MLFDLQGKRRRVVQATYLTLAVLMGGGLVFFGVGGDAPGGLIDAITGGGGNGTGNEIVEERVEENEQRVEDDPRAPGPREDLVRDYYALASGQATTNSTTFPREAQDELRSAATHWGAYLELTESPDPSLARVAIQIFGQAGLNQPESALQAARIVAEDNRQDVSSYLLLVQYAALAGDERTQDLATRRALELAPRGQRQAVQQQIDQITASVVPAGGGGGGGGGQGRGGGAGQQGGGAGN